MIEQCIIFNHRMRQQNICIILHSVHIIQQLFLCRFQFLIKCIQITIGYHRIIFILRLPQRLKSIRSITAIKNQNEGTLSKLRIIMKQICIVMNSADIIHDADG